MKKIIFFILIYTTVSTLLSNSKILIDGSGSMRGFANKKSISVIVNKFETALQKNNMKSDLSVFINKRNSEYYEISSSKKDLDNRKTYDGQLTLLDQAFLNNLKNDILIIITDNIYDSDDSLGAKSTLNFYTSICETAEVKQVDVIPLTAMFSGNPYCGNQNFYVGKRGLLCYVFLLNESKKNKYLDFISTLNQQLDVLHIFPINANHITIKANKNAENNFVINKIGDEFSIERCKVINKATLLSGRRNEINFNLGIKSKYPYVTIKEGTRLELSNLQFKKPSNMEIKAINPIITPDKLKGDLSNNSKTQYFNCKFQLEPKLDFASDFKLLFKKKPIKLSFNLNFNTKKSGLKLDDDINKKYFSTKYNEYDKIYIPENVDLLSFFNTKRSKISLRLSNQSKESKPRTLILVGSGNEIFYALIISVIIILLLIFALIIYKLIKTNIIIDIEYGSKEKDTLKIGPFSKQNDAKSIFKVSNIFYPSLSILNDDWFIDDGINQKKTKMKINKEYKILSDNQEIIVICKNGNKKNGGNYEN